MERVNIVLVEDLPAGEPLEKSLHPKKRRIWNPLEEDTRTPVDVNSSPASSDPVTPRSAAGSRGPVTPRSAASSSGPVTPRSAVGSNGPITPRSTAGRSSPGTPRSTAGSSRSRKVSRRKLTYQRPTGTTEIKSKQNPGSEGESSESGEDEELEESLPHLPPLLPRRLQSILDTPVDDHMDWVPEEEPETSPYDYLSHQPSTMYSFEWRAFPDSPIPPESRRETFSQNNVGPTLPLDDPYNAFTAIWDRPIMEKIVLETNRYAHNLAEQMIDQDNIKDNSRILQWYDTCVDEMYIFFTIIMVMGIVVKSRLDEYWNKSNDMMSTPGISSFMSLRRFQLLSKCLHFNNNEIMNGLELDASQAKLFKIEPIITHLNNKFQQLYVLDRNVALDESLLQWKGLLSINQFIPNKKARVGVKSYEICESKSGYLWRFEIHAHEKHARQQNPDPVSAPIPSIVLRMVQGLENKGYTLWMDNYYNSPALARKLKTLGFDCVGTLRTNRQFVPEDLHNLSKSQMRPGEITGLTSGDVDLMVWREGTE